MAFKFSKLLAGMTLSVSFLAPHVALASDITEKEQSFLNKVNQMLGDQPVSALSVRESMFPPLFEVDLTNGTTILIDEDGKHGVIGGRGGAEVFNFSEGVSLTKERRALNALKYVQNKEPFVTYKANDEKSEIYVFADIQCGYCQLFHDSLPELNASGITVHYIPYAMFDNSDLYMNAAYCSESPEAKYTELTNEIKSINQTARQKVHKMGGNRQDYDALVATEMSRLEYEANAVVNQDNCTLYDMRDVAMNAQGFGIVGTPNILFSNGQMAQGAISPQQIRELAF